MCVLDGLEESVKEFCGRRNDLGIVRLISFRELCDPSLESTKDVVNILQDTREKLLLGPRQGAAGKEAINGTLLQSLQSLDTIVGALSQGT